MLKAKQYFKFSRKYLGIPYAIFLILFVIAPIAVIFYYAFTNAGGQFSLNNLQTFFTTEEKLNTLFLSLVIAALNTILCLIIGYPIAYILAKKEFGFKKVIALLFIMPMWINFVLRTGATRDLLNWIGLNGGDYPIICTLIGMVYNYLPFVILPLYTTMLKMDKSLVEAASDLGASPRQAFVKAVIPLSMPGIVSAATMVFMPTMSSYVISDVMSERMISLLGGAINRSFEQGKTVGGWNMGSFMAIIMLTLIVLTMALTKNIQKEDNARGGLW